MTKMTYAVAIDRAIAGDVDAEVIEKLEALKVQLAKRGSGKHGLTKTQKEGLELMERIVEVLADAEDGMTATEVGDAVEHRHAVFGDGIYAVEFLTVGVLGVG